MVDGGGSGDNWLGADGNRNYHLNGEPDNEDGRGAVITVTYRAAASQHSMCTQGPVMQRYRIRTEGLSTHGLVRLDGDVAALVDIPVAGQQCSYVADWVDSFTYIRRKGRTTIDPESTHGPYFVQDDGHVFKRGDTQVRVIYGPGRQFEPVLPIAVPDDERPGSPGTSLYTDLDFFVRVRPTADSPDGCSTDNAGPSDHAVEPGKTPLELTVIVNESGDVTWSKGGAPLLADVPAGAPAGASCEYTVWYPPVLTSADGGTGDWTLVLQGSRTETVSASMATPERQYLAAPSPQNFIPQVSISVPYIEPSNGNRNVLGNATIFVDYTPTVGSPDGCTESDFDYFFVNNLGSGSSTNAWPPNNAPSRASLVSMPLGASVPCRYVARFQTNLTAGTYDFLIVAGQRAEFAEGERVRAAYADATPFEPMLSFTVTPAPTGGAMSAYAGGVIAVQYVKTAGPTSGCSRDGTLRYVIGIDGTVGPASGAPSLINTVGDDPAACAYELAFPQTVSSAPGAASPWVLRLSGAATETVSASAASHSRSFTAVDAFAPDVSISVPPIDVTVDGASKNLFADVRTSAPGASATYGPVTFQVEFDRSGGPTSGCSDVGATYTVQDDGSVTGDAPALIDRLTATGPRCVYAVTFPTTGLLGGLMKAPHETDDDEVMGGDVAAAATYANGVFDGGVLTVEVTTPPYTGASRSVDVTLTRVATSSTECGARASGQASFMSPAATTVSLELDGSTSLDGWFDYVDFPAGATSAADRCAYTVSWSDTEDVAPPATPLWQRHDGDTTFTGAGRAEPAGVLAATYAVGPPEEVTFDATLTMRLSPRVLASTTFSVTVQPAASQHAMCSSAQPAVTFTAPPPNQDGSDAVLAETVTGLVGQPADVAERCEYVVDWPTNESTGGTLYIQDPDFAETTALSVNSQTAEHRYIADATSFDATLTLAAAAGVPAGTAIEVTVARDPSQPACTDLRQVTMTAPASNPDGTSDASVAAQVAGLVAFAAGATEPCVYAVGWPSEVTAAGVEYIRDNGYADYRTTLSGESATTRAAAARYLPAATAETSLPVTFEVLAGADGPQANLPFSVTVAPTAGSPRGCTPSDTFDVFVGQRNPKSLIDSPAGETSRCTYTVTWPPTEKNGTVFMEDASYASQKTTTLDADHTSVSNQYIRRPTAAVNTGGTNTGAVNPAVNPGGNTGGTRPSSSGGGGGGSRSSSGGSRGSSSGDGGSSGGAAATGPWVVSTSRVPVSVSLAMPQRDFPVGTAIEVMLNVPGTCGDDVAAFAGLPANIGLVYALTARSGTTAQVLAADALTLAGYAERGDQTRDCEVRITLVSAPDGCRLESAEGSANTDDAGRSYVELTGGSDIPSYSVDASLTCG